jgi:glycosyltransferase involved in cell wall biosynthesis
MGAREKVALTYDYSENWIAGTYYVINLIKALNSVRDEEKPHLVILFQRQEGLGLIKEIGYPYISFVNAAVKQGGRLTEFIKRLIRRITKINLYLRYQLKGVQHIFEGSDKYPYIQNHYYWVHDFQEFRLPDFFSKEDADKRSALPKKVSLMSNATLILSSYDALNDFKTFFPGYQCKIGIWRFASSLPEYVNVDFKSQTEKFNINKPYFICSNQFWQHKNHKVVLEAVDILKGKNLDFMVVFTGKNYDHRNSNYYSELKEFSKNNGLEPWIRFCGFLDRKIQLSLAKNSLSYIQPSLFEGWSTTVEDAKNMNKYILLSDIPVHREQINYNVEFFDPYNAMELAEKMEGIIGNPPVIEKRDYSENIRIFGEEIVKTFCK